NLRKSIMDLNAQMNQVSLALKQVLNIPLVYLVDLEDVSIDDPQFFLSDKTLLAYLEDPVSFDLLTDYLVREGIAQSSEVRQLDAVIAAQGRNLASLRSSFFLPTVAAFAGYTNTFYKSAVQSPFQLTNIPAPPPSMPPEIPPYLGQLFSAISPPLPNQIDWNVGIRLSLNLFEGFSTSARAEQASQSLQQYQVQREGVKEKVALRIRIQMEGMKAAHFAILQARLEQDAARKGLEIVTDAYSRGAVPILSLLDAQNSALGADLIAANAQYDFFIAYMQLQRSLGRFDMLMTTSERQELLDRVLQSMKEGLKR
ncbi:MAG: TolC family protein, partial [Bacteroidota bacterium]